MLESTRRSSDDDDQQVLVRRGGDLKRRGCCATRRARSFPRVTRQAPRSGRTTARDPGASRHSNSARTSRGLLQSSKLVVIGAMSVTMVLSKMIMNKTTMGSNVGLRDLVKRPGYAISSSALATRSGQGGAPVREPVHEVRDSGSVSELRRGRLDRVELQLSTDPRACRRTLNEPLHLLPCCLA